MIGYDLKEGENYSDLIEAIKKIGNWWHCLDSTWIVKTDRSPVEIRDFLMPHIRKDDRLLVATLTGEAAWCGFNEQCSQWLKDNL
jgi:hypothetical protein